MSVRKDERQPLPIDPADLDVDPAVTAALGRPRSNDIYDRIVRARRMTPAQRRKAEKDRKRSKETYDLPAWLIGAIAEIAAAYGVPKSNVAAHLLALGLRQLLDGQVNLRWMWKASRSPLFEGLLEAPQEIDSREIERYCNEQK
jgi:hypothetical protein